MVIFWWCVFSLSLLSSICGTLHLHRLCHVSRVLISTVLQVAESYPKSRAKDLFEAEITLINRGLKVFPNSGWSIFFNQVLLNCPRTRSPLHHWNGELYSLEPTDTFSDINPGDVKAIRYYSRCCSVTFTDALPNWPVKIVAYNPSSTVNVLSGGWEIVSDSLFNTSVSALQEKWKLSLTKSLPKHKYIHLINMEVSVESNGRQLAKNEAYELSVSPATESITVKASHAAGAFYAIQSLFSLTDEEGNIPETTITDGPRYRYRGLMIDVARNFHGKETIMKYIDAMAMYKLNKLHFHLTDDEGWRLEIPGLPELTEIGGKRCHNPSETVCLLPFLGSGPHSVAPGSGFYTTEDYRAILRHAAARHVEIIPEIDMPGHSHAAIKAMHARFVKLASSDPVEAARYLLSDLQDVSQYASVQNFKDGAVNPCIQSTYIFISKIMKTLVELHQDISPLKTFHYGGDEVPRAAWIDSPLCKKFDAERLDKSLKQVFAESVSKIAARYNLDLAAWEDGLLKEGTPLPRSTFSQNNIYIYAWNNQWAIQQAKLAYTFANAGYKVVLTPATNTYFDHPYEPDPTERGLIWATRFISTKKVFTITPENIYTIEGTTMSGQHIPECLPQIQDTQCPALEDKNNIEGIQASLFGELLRNEQIMDYMVFPRLLALAERAWHAANWENEPDKIKKQADMDEDWVKFANTLGHRELARLDSRGYLYRIPPPGAIVHTNKVKASVEFPGLQVQISTDEGNTWTHIPPEGISKQAEEKIILRTKAAASDRYSRIVHLDYQGGKPGLSAKSFKKL
ncbi:unnamed protein product [Candidula unifasciata]|uniref:beta-N-acetylhexosaminidase n=1 Tax=Candidula unifasciata TaxID=100452 RepID=A0A8S3YW54_9EUPU|nr:unnamed protein product [Candidula unifasciata]